MLTSAEDSIRFTRMLRCGSTWKKLYAHHLNIPDIMYHSYLTKDVVKSLEADVVVSDTDENLLGRWWMTRIREPTRRFMEFKMGIGEEFMGLLRKWSKKHHEYVLYYIKHH